MKNFFRGFRVIEILYLIAAIIVSAQRYFLHHYNNFEIYRHSTFHFFEKVNLYLAYPEEYHDRFLYTPGFALLFAPFAYLPELIGIFFWVSVVLMVYYYSIRLLPFDRKQLLFIYGFTLIELVTSAQNLQTNPLIAAFIVFTFIYLEKEKIFRASVFPSLGFFIKGFGIISVSLFILKRPKFRNFLYLAIWFVFLLCLPLVYYSPAGVIDLYKQWVISLSSGHEVYGGISMIGLIISIFSLKVSFIWIQIFGLLLFLSTLVVILIRKNYEQVKLIFLAYILIWVVIFNHVAESSTYIIACTGIAIWYIKSERSWVDNTLLVMTFILTILSPTDIFPDSLYQRYVYPFALKALGPSLIWLKIQYSLFLKEMKPVENV